MKYEEFDVADFFYDIEYRDLEYCCGIEEYPLDAFFLQLAVNKLPQLKYELKLIFAEIKKSCKAKNHGNIVLFTSSTHCCKKYVNIVRQLAVTNMPLGVNPKSDNKIEMHLVHVDKVMYKIGRLKI